MKVSADRNSRGLHFILYDSHFMGLLSAPSPLAGSVGLHYSKKYPITARPVNNYPLLIRTSLTYSEQKSYIHRKASPTPLF